MLRRTLNTPSWAEAQRIASHVLHGYDPEIAASRKLTEEEAAQLVTVKEAGELWISRSLRAGSELGTTTQLYRTQMRQLQEWADEHGVQYIQEITTIAMERWYSSPKWSRLAMSTRQNRWSILRSFFRYLVERKVLKESPIAAIKPIKPDADLVQGPYSDEQIEKITAAVATASPRHVQQCEQGMFVERLSSLLTLLLNTGCDIMDAIKFQPDNITWVVLDGRRIPVYTYARQKTKGNAVIPISEEVAQQLTSIPLPPGYQPTMPFRSDNPRILGDRKMWTERLMRCIKASGVKYVILPTLDSRGRPKTKPANIKQFRHTFAVWQLRAGQRPEEVATMMGHVDTTTIRKHYAPWVPDLNEAHIRRVIERR
ncbi:MAG TPA: tyrosine-type recombinase/integrase [Acidisarcina sp.]|nr:tyrosine-type recombinase/integrase [Acidisarcina sp.]